MSICLKTKEEVQSWLDKNEIKNYIINDNLIVDVKDTVYLINKITQNINYLFNLERLIKILYATGDFYLH